MDDLKALKEKHLQTKVFAEAIYYALEEAIVTGLLEPGQLLHEAELADMLEVSRTPIREALNKLLAEGLVARALHGSYYVKDYSIIEIAEMIQAIEGLRVMTSVYAAENSIDKITRSRLEATLEDIEMINKNQDQATQNRLRYKLDEQFHEVICDTVGNRFLSEFYNKLSKSIRIVYNTVLAKDFSYSYDNHASEERKALLEAILARDAEAAFRISMQHSEHSFKKLTRIMRNHE